MDAHDSLSFLRPGQRATRARPRGIGLSFLVTLWAIAAAPCASAADPEPAGEQFPGPVAVSVIDFGAKGDGNADDAAAIRRAIEAVADAGGGTVRLPAGAYLLQTSLPGGEALRLPSGVRLVSDEGARLIGAGHGAPPGSEWEKGPILRIDDASGCEVRGLRFEGPGQAIYLSDAQRCIVRDCSFAGHAPMAIYAERCSQVDVRDCAFERTDYGLYLRGPVNWRIQDCRFHSFGRAIEAQGAVSCQITGNLIDGGGEAIVGILLFPNSEPRFGSASTVGNLIAHNEVRGIREEGISLDCRGNAPQWYYGLPGMVTASDADSFTDTTTPAEDLALAPSCHVVILEGRGAGQYRRVESVEGGRLRVTPPWRVLPDTTSRYCLLRAAVANQIIGNRVSDVGLTSIYLHGASLANLVSGNTVTGARGDGIGIASLQPDVYQAGGTTFPRVLASWYNQVCGNVLSGRVPGEKPGSGIFLRNYYGDPAVVRNYGNVVCDNLITDYEIGISLECQQGALIRGNRIALAATPIREGSHLAECTLEQNTAILQAPVP